MQESLDPNNEEWEDLNKEQMGKPKMLPRQTESPNPTSSYAQSSDGSKPLYVSKSYFSDHGP